MSQNRSTMPQPVKELIDTALGAEHRDDPVVGNSGGPAGNAQLTAWLGLLLLVAFAVEGFTLLALHQLLNVHLFVGAFLVPLTLLKSATTTWRMARYYMRDGPYRQAGPPPLVLRLLGPAVVLTTLALLGTGLALVADPHTRQLLFLHQASFVLWFAVMTVHTLARVIPSVQLAAPNGRARRVPGGAMRALTVLATVAVGIAVGIVVLHVGYTQPFEQER